ncbi:MAG: putative esterase [Myxococcota bacterium]|jgi:predicted esterase
MWAALLPLGLIAAVVVVAPPASPGFDAGWDGFETAETLRYRVIQSPELPPDAPVLIAIHGLGDSARGFSRFARRLRLPFRVVVPDGPKPWRPGTRGRSWYNLGPANAEVADVAASTHRLVRLIDQLSARWPQAPPPFVIGFSQGGVMVYQLAARHPRMISGGVAVAGYLVPRELRLPRSQAAPPVLIIHGRRDKRIKFEQGRDAETRFRESGYPVELFEHPQGHTIPRAAVARARRWLLEQARSLNGQ